MKLRFEPHEKQTEVMLLDNRIVCAFAGPQSGKTHLGVHLAWREYQHLGGCDGLITAPTYKVLNQATMRKFLTVTPSEWGTYHKTDGEYRTQWGHTFYCRTDAKSEAIEGMTVGFAWPDELCLYKRDTWDRILDRGSILHARYFPTSTIHRGQNWVYSELYQPWLAKDPDIGLVQWRSIDSPYFSKDEWEFHKRRMRPSLFRMKYEAQFEKLEGLVYNHVDREKITCQPFPIPKDWPRWVSVDFGINHAFVFGWWAYGSHKPGGPERYWLTRLYYKRGLHIQDQVPALARNNKMSGFKMAYAGSKSEVQFREDLKKAFREKGIGLTVTSAFDSVEGGIETVYRIIAEDKLRVFNLPCMAPLWDEFATYQYKEDATGNFTDDIADKDEYDVMDMVRYGLASREKKPKPEVFMINV